jgi:hypothetical protein
VPIDNADAVSALQIVLGRHSVSPKHLRAPGPTAAIAFCPKSDVAAIGRSRPQSRHSAIETSRRKADRR